MAKNKQQKVIRGLRKSLHHGQIRSRTSDFEDMISSLCGKPQPHIDHYSLISGYNEFRYESSNYFIYNSF